MTERRAYPIRPEWALRAANFRDAELPGILCKTCAHFAGLEGRCVRFDTEVSMTKICDEWTPGGS